MPRFFLDTFAGEDDYNIRVDILGFPGEGIGGSIESFQFNSNVTAEMGGVTGAQASKAKFSSIVSKGLDRTRPSCKPFALVGKGYRVCQSASSACRKPKMQKDF